MRFVHHFNIGGVEREVIKSMIKISWNAGINFFDIANENLKEESEKNMGRAVKEVGTDRRQTVIATKVRGDMSDAAAEGTGVTILVFLVNISLRRWIPVLIGLVWTTSICTNLWRPHGYSYQRDVRALKDSIGIGKGRYIGWSNLTVRQLAKSIRLSKKHDWSSFISLQGYLLCGWARP